jgi:hypothetical protein
MLPIPHIDNISSFQLLQSAGVRVSCVAVDAKSSLVAVADNGCQLLLYTQTRV